MVEIASKIESVVVYHGGATVTRTATIAGPELPRSIVLPGLPLALADGTVKLSIEAASGAHVYATGVRIGLHTVDKDDVPEPPAKAAIRAVEREIDQLTHQSVHLALEIARLQGLQVPHRPEGEEGKAPPPSPVSARLALDGFVNEAVSRRTKEKRELTRALKQKREDIIALRQAHDRASSAHGLSPGDVTKTIVAALRSKTSVPGGVVVRVSYHVPGARWVPTYQCFIERDGQAARIQMRAQVSQYSGEDWKGARLKLSTAAPMQWTELPELNSIRIGEAQPPAAGDTGFRPPPQGAVSLFSDYLNGLTRAQKSLPSRGYWRAPSLSVTNLRFAQTPMIGSSGGDGDDRVEYFGNKAYGEMEAEEVEAEPTMMRSVSVGGAPPPSPAAPPPPARNLSAAPQGKRKRRKSMDKERASKLTSSFQAPGFGGAVEPPARPRFSTLQLAAFNDSRRGQLIAEAVNQRLSASLRGRVSDYAANKAATYVAMAQSEAMRSAGNVRLPAGTVDVRQSAGRFDYAYETALPVDVPSDGAFHSIPVDARDADCDLQYVVVPRVDTGVYRLATIENPNRAPLLPGPVEIYVGGEYVLTTQLPTVAPKERFRLGLGVEQAIKCARNTHYEEKRSGDAVVATLDLRHRIDIELVNNLGREIDCEVRERLPQPAKDAEVVIEEVAIEPAWEAYDQKERGRSLKGGRRWKVSVAAGESKKLKAEYAIKIYVKNEVVGGNRREA